MKYLKIHLLFYPLMGLLVASTSLSAQATYGAPSNFESTSQIMDVIENKLREDKKIIYDMTNVVGSPYLTEEFVRGTLFLNEKNYGDYLFRYNIFRDEIEFKKDTYASIESVKKIEGITITLEDGTRILVQTLTIANNTYERKFLIELLDGNYQLNKLVRATFSAPKKAETPLSGDSPAIFTKYEDFYVVYDDKVIKLGSKKKELKKQFPKDGDKMIAFVDQEKINLKNEDELLKLFRYMNNL
jgi:hypothetical protein